MKQLVFLAVVAGFFMPGPVVAGNAPACNTIINADMIERACGVKVTFKVERENPGECRGNAWNQDKSDYNKLLFRIATLGNGAKAAEEYETWVGAVKRGLNKDKDDFSYVSSFAELSGIGKAAVQSEQPNEYNEAAGLDGVSVKVLTGNHFIDVHSSTAVIGRTLMCSPEQLQDLARAMAGKLDN